jgi:hypothetical protein
MNSGNSLFKSFDIPIGEAETQRFAVRPVLIEDSATALL